MSRFALGIVDQPAGVEMPDPIFDLDERALTGGTLVPLDAPLADDVLAAIPTWASEIEGGGEAWGAQNPGFDVVVFIKRPLDGSVWVAEGGGVGSGTLTGTVEPTWAPGVSDGGYTWYPVDASYPTVGTWEAETSYDGGALVAGGAFIWARYPTTTDSGTTEPDWAAGVAGNYVGDGDGYWYPIGTAAPVSLLTVWPDQGAEGNDAILDPDDGSTDAQGFVVGTDHGHTTVTGHPGSRLTVKCDFPVPDAAGYIATTLMLVTLGTGGNAVDGTVMYALTYDPSSGQKYETIESTDGDLPASQVSGYDFEAQTGGPQPGETYIVTKVHNDGAAHGTDNAADVTIPRGYSHVDGFVSPRQTTATVGGDIDGPDVMIGGFPGFDDGLCGRIHRVVSYPGALTAAQELAARQMLRAQAAADGITVTLYDHTDPSDIAIGWEPSNAELPGLIDIWYVPDDAEDGADLTEIVGAVNGVVISNNVTVGTVGTVTSLDGDEHRTCDFDGSAPLILDDLHLMNFTREDAGKWWFAFAMITAADFDDGALLGNETFQLGSYLNGPFDGRAFLFYPTGADLVERAPHCWRANLVDFDHGTAWCFQYDNSKRALSTSGNIADNNDGQGISNRSSGHVPQGTLIGNAGWRYMVDTLNDDSFDGSDPTKYFALGAASADAATGAGNNGGWVGRMLFFAMGEGVLPKDKANLLMAWAHRRGKLAGPFVDRDSLPENN